MRLVRLELYIATMTMMASLALLPPASGAGVATGMTGTAAGIEWTVPGIWTQGKTSSMRVATYVAPGTDGADAGECAVFYFGGGQGGGVDENVQRWARQFKDQPTPKRAERTVAGMNVTLVDIEGTYLNPGGGRMQSRGASPDYRLLGAIVDAPDGRVFFKFTGPQATLEAAQVDFEALIGSITIKGQ